MPYYSKTMPKYKKVFYTVFVNGKFPVVQVAIIPNGRSTTGHVYKNYELKKVKKHNERKRPKSGIRNIDSS